MPHKHKLCFPSEAQVDAYVQEHAPDAPYDEMAEHLFLSDVARLRTDLCPDAELVALLRRLQQRGIRIAYIPDASVQEAWQAYRLWFQRFHGSVLYLMGWGVQPRPNRIQDYRDHERLHSDNPFCANRQERLRELLLALIAWYERQPPSE